MTSIANTVDSLYVIKKLIFERKAFTFAQLLVAIDNNFNNGHGRIHKAIVQLEGKWGNGDSESDELARRSTGSSSDRSPSCATTEERLRQTHGWR